MRLILFSVLMLWTVYATAQNPRIDTVAFHLDNQLLVFRGTVNGVDTDFAFDTGAQSSVSNSTNNAASNITVDGSGRKVVDSNQQVGKIGKIKISELTVGNYRVSNLKAVTFDMPYLTCAKLLLLGQDVIKRFNWLIDFEKKVLCISETPFPVDSIMDTWPLKYEGNRPVVAYTLNGTTYKNCLIDFGFTGVFDLNSRVKEGVHAYEVQKLAGKVTTYQRASMGLMGLGKPVPQNDFVLDSIYFGKTLVRQIPVVLDERTDTKIGTQFFTTFCSQVVLNYSTNMLHVAPSGQPVGRKNSFDANIAVVNGKLTVSGKNIMPNSTAATLNIDEAVKSVNGKVLPDFATECDFMLWYYGAQGSQLIVEKLTGEKIIVLRRDQL